ncbi:MAG: CGNR zinc finger domain-containing protein [Candidatus Tumulicola sp.]
MQLGSLSLNFTADGLDEEADVAGALAEVLTFEPVVRAEERADAIRLHDALARAFAAAAEGSPLADRDVATINSHAADELPTLRLTREGRAARASTDPVRASLAALARDAIETIARDGHRLRICADDDCLRVYLDRSHGKRRRWCSMQGCGNRAKVAAFRRRSSG